MDLNNMMDLLMIIIILILLKKEGANFSELTNSCLIYFGFKYIISSIIDLW